MKIVRQLAALLVIAAAPISAQQEPGKPLSLDAFDQWRTISERTVSDDGRWVVYSTVPQVGDGELIVRGLAGGPEFRHSRGFTGRPVNQPSSPAADRYSAAPARITADGRWVLFTI